MYLIKIIFTLVKKLKFFILKLVVEFKQWIKLFNIKSLIVKYHESNLSGSFIKILYTKLK